MATFRPVTPQDRHLFEEGLENLSEQSRFARFGRGVGRLTEADLRYLTDVDQRSHVAWGALVGEAPAGVGRYIVSPAGGDAEVALTVVDRFQGRGLGRLLFLGLVAVARLDGVPQLFFAARVSNDVVIRVLRGIDLKLESDGEMVSGRIPVGNVPEEELEREFVAVMERFRRERDHSSGSSSSDSELTQ